MAEFDVFTSQISDEAKRIIELRDKLKKAQKHTSEIGSNLSFNIRSKSTIKSRLKGLSEALSEEASSVGKMADALSSISEIYIKYEKKILNSCKDGEITMAERQNLSPKSVSAGFLSDSVTIKKDLKKRKDLFKKKGYFDKDGWHDESDTDDGKTSLRDHISDVKIVSTHAGYEIMYAGREKEGEHGSYSYKILDYERHADSYAGLMGLDKDGHKVFAPGAGFEVGTSITALTASAQGKIGNDLFGAYTGVDVTVGKVEGKISGKIGFVDNKLNASVNASAEAIAGEIKGNIGAKVAGTDVKGEIGINYGIGGHFNVGVDNGKLKFDIGATLGVGVSANIEIDFSGTVDAVKKGIKDTTKKVGNCISSLFKWK